jgi:hypothetical protein
MKIGSYFLYTLYSDYHHPQDLVDKTDSTFSHCARTISTTKINKKFSQTQSYDTVTLTT